MIASLAHRKRPNALVHLWRSAPQAADHLKSRTLVPSEKPDACSAIRCNVR